MKFVFDNNLPIYIQLVEQLKIYILSEKLKLGEKLPSVRELAFITKVNPNTVQKALTELEDMRLIYTERTNGKFVTKDKRIIIKLKEKYARDLTKSYFDGMERIGFSKNDTMDYLEKLGE